MKLIVVISFLILGWNAFAQKVSGTIVDDQATSIPGVKVQNKNSNALSKSDFDGSFSISAQKSDTLLFTIYGFDTLTYIVEASPKSDLKISLSVTIQEVGEVNVISQRMADFDVGFLPPIKGVQIYTGTNAVIELGKLSGAKSTGNPREIFAKVPGLNIWESDGAGIQMGIGGRGLSPNRTANFNTRQNGHDISADALGYPESYYTPPIEALKSIEIIRGSAALQFGTQFGGLLNFIIKSPPTTTSLEWTTRNTVGSYGYHGFFNRIAGSHKRFFYQVYHQYKGGNGYRDRSKFGQHQAFGQLGYYLNEKHKVRVEYTHMNYLTQQAGGLTDYQFEEDPRITLRDRNWFDVDWNMLALHYDWDISTRASFNVRAFGMLSQRKTLGFLGKITQADPGGNREMLSGQFKNAGVEARYLSKYKIAKNKFKNINGAFLVGARYYQGRSTADQGVATDGDGPDFSYLNPNDLEGSSFVYPSQNIAGFMENIFFLGKRWKVNAGVRLEHIQSGASGYYKQYIVHPVNLDTLAVYRQTDSSDVVRTVPLFGAGVSYNLGKASNIYSNFTQNYRAINFTDIRVTNPNVVVDSLIKDEYGYTAELGYRGLIKDYLIVDLAGFYVFYGDKIGLAPKAGTIQKERTNIGDARNFGVELFTEIDFLKAFVDSTDKGLSLFINTAYINSRYITSKEPNYIGKEVEYVSPWVIRSGLKFKSNRFVMQIQGSYNARQYSDATNAEEPSGDAVIGLIPAYLVFDFSSRYNFKHGFSLEFGINNFTNQQYFTRRATGYPGPGILPSDGINGYLTLQYQIKK